MATYRLTNQAAQDVAGIAEFTIRRFGVSQARRYRDGLERCFSLLADNPYLGSAAESLAPELRRFSYRSHVVFYKPLHTEVLIVRILHGRMNPDLHM